MNKKPKFQIKPSQPITIELATETVAAIVADYFNRQFNAQIPIEDKDQILPRSLQKQIVRKHLAARTKSKKTSKCPNNPKPRAERLTQAFIGNPADFETTPASISVEIENTINRVLAMSSVDRAKRYNGPLRLHAYSHETYKWFATMGKKVAGHPIRRFFADLNGAVTWLEVAGDRWLAGKLQNNLPMGGVSRGEFRMPWQSHTTRSGDGRQNHAPKVPARKQNSPRKSPWTADRRAKLADTLKDKKAYHSVQPLQQKQRVRSCATTAQILGAVYLPMPGNNLATAINDGSTAAVALTPEPT